MKALTPDIITRLEEEKNIWLATVRPDSRPHLVPVWFIYEQGAFYVCISGQSVKFNNLAHNQSVAVALENGSRPVIIEGSTVSQSRPWPENIVHQFKQKYDWEIETDKEYDSLLRIVPAKVLQW